MSDKTNKRTIIADAINEGGATKEDLMSIANVDSKGLASQFSYLRLTGQCPVVDENGIYSLISASEWEELKAQRVPKAKKEDTRSPEEKLAAAQKRVEKCEVAVKAASDRLARNTDEDSENKLAAYSDLRKAELVIAQIALDELS